MIIKAHGPFTGFSPDRGAAPGRFLHLPRYAILPQQIPLQNHHVADLQTFKRPVADWQDAPSFFFELGAETWRYGMGFYSASKETMDRMRQQIERKPAEFQRSIAFLAKQGLSAVSGLQCRKVLDLWGQLGARSKGDRKGLRVTSAWLLLPTLDCFSRKSNEPAILEIGREFIHFWV
jgi:hypothetical protein